MLLLCTVDNIETAVIGWAPGKNGAPVAIVPWRRPDGSYGPRWVVLGDITFPRLPDRMRRKLKKVGEEKHQKGLENTKKMAEALATGGEPPA